jgi:integrase
VPTSTIWIERNGNMSKLNQPSPARLVKQQSNEWYIVWYVRQNDTSVRYRQKFGLNRIKDLNERQKWADSILSFINNSHRNGEQLTPEAVETHLANRLPFNDFLVKYIEVRVNILSVSSLKALRVHRNRLNEYAVEVLKKEKIDFSDFTLQFPLSFQNWAYAAPRSWSRNYCAKTFQIIKMLLSEAVEQGVIETHVHRSKKYSVSQTDVEDVALDMAQLEALMAYTAFDRPALVQVRDVFVFGCLTGLRYCDFSRLTRDNFKTLKDEKGNHIPIVNVITQKTGERVVIPLHQIAMSILKDNGGTLPKVYANQIFNRYLKEVCQVVGFTEMITLKKNTAGKQVIETLPLYKAISAHTARRTFATMAYVKLKMPAGLIMKITGHKTEKEFFKYIKITKDEAAIEMAAYFQTSQT